MRWEELTAKEFPGAVRAAGGVCVVPIGCMEKHGDHLPLGTDVYEARRVAELAAAEEPAVIFPTYYVAQIAEARHLPGTVSYSHRVRWDLLTETVDEIARNGLTKIILLNGHGGNIHWLNYFAQAQLERRAGTSVFVAWPYIEDEATSAIFDSSVDGHAGERETSLMMCIEPDLVRLADLDDAGLPLDRAPVTDHEGLFHGMGWYSKYPRHYCGDGSYGTVEKGQTLLAACVKRTVEFIRAVKADAELAELEREFHGAAASPLVREEG